MFPHIDFSKGNRKDALPEPQPPPPKPTMSVLPALNPHRLRSYAALDSIGILLPQISHEAKESKSVSVKELIDRIAINNKLLYFELSAIRIQSLVRRFLARLRIHRLRRRLALFLRVTEACAERYVEEFVLATAFEIALEHIRKHQKFVRMRDSVDRSLITCSDDILQELMDEMTVELTKETISEAIDVIMTLR